MRVSNNGSHSYPLSGESACLPSYLKDQLKVHANSVGADAWDGEDGDWGDHDCSMCMYNLLCTFSLPTFLCM